MYGKMKENDCRDRKMYVSQPQLSFYIELFFPSMAKLIETPRTMLRGLIAQN